MPSKRMLPHTAILKNYMGEDADNRAQYQASVITGAYCEPISKSDQTAIGPNPADLILLFIFDRGSSVTAEDGLPRTFTSPAEWDVLDAEGREAAWTLTDGKDKIVFNDVEYLISSVERYGTGNKRMWHWEVYAR